MKTSGPPRKRFLAFCCRQNDNSAATSSRSDRASDPAGISGTWSAFVQFMTTYNKTYANEAEMKNRYGIFKENMKMAKLLQENEKGM